MNTITPKWLQSAVVYLLDNIFDIATVVVAAYIVIRHEFRPFGPNDIADLATWILAVLALVAVSNLWQYRRRLAHIEKISTETREVVVRHLGGQAHAEDFFWANDIKISEQDFAQAQDVYVVGMILNRTVRNHMATFGDMVRAGTNLRFIILDPQDDALMSILPYRSYGSRSKEWWQARITQTEGHIEDIPNSENVLGTLKIGYLPYFPSFGMWLIDPDKPYGKIFVEIYHHKTAEVTDR